MSYRLEAVTKRYGDITALKGIDLTVKKEILGIIGHSGAGKTTLLRIMAGLEDPTSGTIQYDNSSLTPQNLPTLRREVTMIFQTPLFLRGDVYTNLAYGLQLRKTTENKLKPLLDNILNVVRLSDYGNRNARSLSGGEQQRVALARALLLEPNVLLLDEPTSNLDPANAGIINEVLKEESLKRTVVIATHDLSQVTKIADRVVFLENGVIKEEGAPQQMESITRFTENMFTGNSMVEQGVAQVDVGKITIRVSSPVEGRVSLHVRPEDIIVSLNWIETSARNQFRGPIVGIEENNGIVKISVDVGEVFRVQITRRSYAEMGLTLGKEVNISFKASSVILL